MKKKLVITLGIVFALIASVFMINVKPHVSYAAEGDPITAETILTADGHFESDALYGALREVAGYIKSYNGVTGSDNELKAGDLASVTELDLTYERMSVTFIPALGGDAVTYKFFEEQANNPNWYNPRYKITSVFGLDSVLFSNNFTSLILDKNQISVVESFVFTNMPKLNKLSIRECGLTSIAFPSGLPLQEVNLESNELETVDLSCLQQKGYNPAECHLENNKFALASNITLPAVTSAKVNLYLAQNYLTDAVKTDFGGHNASLLIQGIRRNGNVRLTANTYIRVTSDLAAEGFTGGEHIITAKAFYREGSEFYSATAGAVATSDADGKLVLPAGKLVIKFYNNNVEYTTGNFTASPVDVYPNAPLMGVEKDGKMLDEVPKAIKGTFKIIAFAPTDNAVMEVKFSNDVWTAGNEVTIKENGEYTIYARVTIDGLTSSVSFITIQNTNSARYVWALIIVVGAVILVVGGIYLYKWFKSGGVVAPLTDREIIKEQQRQRKRDMKDNQNKK